MSKYDLNICDLETIIIAILVLQYAIVFLNYTFQIKLFLLFLQVTKFKLDNVTMWDMLQKLKVS